MRLLLYHAYGDLSLVEKHDGEIPPYAILSHTWGADGEEFTFKDLMEGTGKNKLGYRKIEFCGAQAARDGLHHFWVDTCCIDKSSSSELMEAINSMFRWYQNSAKCYVFLADVSTSRPVTNILASSATWEAAFQGSRWFGRGWTLQELIAPASVEFFSCDGTGLGSKRSLEQQIHHRTGIPITILQGESLDTVDVEERFSWARNRSTERQEDGAYCLLGIFNVRMWLDYGEGKERAFERLRKKIGKSLERKRPRDVPHNKTFAAESPYKTDKFSNRTYRVKHIPGRFDADTFKTYLAGLPGEDFGLQGNITIHSLAPNLHSKDNPQPMNTQVATLSFQKTPTPFCNERERWTICTKKLGLEHDLFFDVEFYGFTPLNRVDNREHVVDCIAIPGLGSHGFGTWKKSGSNFMWLRDWLPTELRGARAIIYGYDSELGNSESFQDMGELVLRFIQLLEAIAPSFYSDPSVSPQRVIVLFGHSMGGILLKHALIKMNHSGSPLQKVILGMIKEVVFFGVPNRGMQISHFRAMVEGNPNEKLVERLRENSPYLEEIDRLFFDVAMERRIRLISVFETLRSRSMRQNMDGRWTKDGPSLVLVNKASAVQTGTKEPDKLPINKDHSDLVNFDEGDEDYLVIFNKIREAVQDSRGPQPVRPSTRSVRYTQINRAEQKDKNCLVM